MRHLSRHLQATLQNHIEEYLTFLDWIGPAEDTPFGALPVTYQTKRPTEAELQAIKPNLVAVSFGPQGDDDPVELGGGLTSQEHVVFVDILAENEGVALALSEDVRDLFVGRASHLSYASRFVKVVDQMTATPVPGYVLELEDVVRGPNDRQVANAEWQIVTARALLHLPGVE